MSKVDEEVDDHRRRFGVGAPPAPVPIRFPYLVIRWMAAVYGVAEIVIIPRDDRPPVGHGLKVVVESYRVGAELDTTTRHRIIDAAVTKSRHEGLQLCVVFAPDDSIYIGPDGKFVRSDHAPRAGLRIDDITIRND